MSESCNLLAHELVLRHTGAHRDRPAIVSGDETLTYGELGYRVAAVAEGLRRRGVRKGDRVVVLIPMSAELYLVLLAVASLGAVAVFVEPKSSLSEISRVIDIAKPRAFVGIPKAHALRLRYRNVARVPIAIAVTSRLAARAVGAVSLDEIEIEGEGAALPRVAMKPADPVLLTFSSGTTGEPKGAARTHAFLAAQHAAIGRMVRRRDGVCEVEMSAFAIVLLSTLCAGNTAVIPRLGRGGVDDVDGAALVRELDARRITILSGSPAFLAPIFDAATGQHLFHLRRIVTGGAPVPVSMCETADETLLPKGSLLVVYGSTEAEPIATIDASEVRNETAAATRAGHGLCVGRPDAEIGLRLLEPTEDALAVGPEGIDGLSITAPREVGEIAVAGPHVNQTYYRNPDAVRRTKLIDETGTVWHRTGDAGYLDEDGRLWIVGRIADIVRRGTDVYHPAAVEAAAQAIPGVERAALIEDGHGGTRLIVQSRHRIDARSVTDQLADAGIVVDDLRRARELPLDPRHRAKIDYQAVRQEYAK